MKHPNIPIIFLAAAMTMPMLAVAEDDDDEEIPFDEAELFFELNNTDGDLGIHGKVDGGPWKRIEIEGPDGPNERTLLKVRAKGPLRRQGMTELFFESEEPTFDELSPEEFFERFPEGEYEIEGKGLAGEELESEVELSHTMPAPPDGVMVSGIEPDLEGECEEPLLSVEPPIVISWEPVTMSHPDLGNTGEDVTIDYYEVVVENDDGDEVMSTILPAVDDEGAPRPTSLTIPDDYISLSDEWKFEILAREENGNKTAIESCFGIIEP